MSNISRKSINLGVYFLFFLPILITAYLLVLKYTPAGIIGYFNVIKINNPDRLNSFINQKLIAFIFIYCFTGLFFYLRTKDLSVIKNKILPRIDSIITAFQFRILISLVIIYIITLFCISIINYDLGFDEAWWLEFSKNFFRTLISFDTSNGKPFIVDNLTMLPMLVLAAINFMFGFTEVWHFKLLSSIASLSSLALICRILYKKYNLNTSVLFLIIVIIQPGFGFVSSSFFGEVVQSAFFFLGVYIWFKKELPLNKDLLLTALCFSLAIQTKVQIAIIFVISLIIFSFIAKDKKPFKVLIYTIFFTALFIAIRTIPVLFSDSVYIVSLVKWYGGISSTFVQPDIMKILARLRLFDRFLSIVLLFTILVFLIKYLRTELEKFVYIFTSAAFFWWIFIFQLSTYRHLFIAIIPLCFLLSIMIERYFYFNHVKEKWNTGFFKYTAKAVLLLAIIYGFSINIFYAYVGYNDGVQFDLDGNKPASFLSVSHDDCQKNFYKEIKNYIKPSDTLYLGSYVTKFYLPNPVYDYRVLRNNIYEAPSEKLVLIGRDMFPISLNDGYAAIDTLKVKRELVLKKGSFELYKVNSIK